MKVVVRREAADDLEHIYAWIAKDNPAAAAWQIRTIRRRIDLLLISGMARMGRRGRDLGTFELVEGAYIIVYEIIEDRKEIVILSVFNTSEDR